MEVSEIIKSLKSLISKGTKVSDIEKEIGMPVNNLSSILKSKRVLPKKWIQPLEDFIKNKGRKRVVLIEDENGNFICNGKKVRLIWEEKDYSNKISEIDPKAGDMQVANKGLHDNIISDIKFSFKTPESYDGKRASFYTQDEVGQWEEPKIDNSEILKQIEAIRAEKIPKDRDTILGRKLWRIEQDNRIGELKSKLIDQ